MAIAKADILLVNSLQNELKEEGGATVISFYGVGQKIKKFLNKNKSYITELPSLGGSVLFPDNSITKKQFSNKPEQNSSRHYNCFFYTTFAVSLPVW